MTKYEIAVIGGDFRQTYMADFLEERGYQVICFDVKNQEKNAAEFLWQAVAAADIIVGGIPLIAANQSFDSKELLSCVREGQMLFAGMITDELRAALTKKRAVCYDFMKEEEIAVFNAVATAEGAIMEAMSHSATNIHKSKCLVLGYGRCGMLLSDKLKGLGAKVTVCSKEEKELAYADALGMQAITLEALDTRLREYAYIFNTIPAPVLHKGLLKSVAADAVVIDIASGEGGTDMAWANRLGICVQHCLGIPGKYAAKTSALKLTDFVEKKGARLLRHGHERI